MTNISENRICQNCKNDFKIEPDDFGFYEKMQVPLPTFCPECRLIRRLAWRNEKGLHSRECDLCKIKIISIYNESSKKNVYCGQCWWGDGWEAGDYAKDIDFSQPFLKQFFELFHKVPAPNLFATAPTMINSAYCNMANDMRNCYLVHDGTFAENVAYGSGVFYCKDSMDITRNRKCELCYEIVSCINCYQTIFSRNSEDCVNVSFSDNLHGCNNCFGCVNLHKKSYCIWNEQYSKEEYELKIKSFNLNSHKSLMKIKEKAHEFWKKFPKKYYFGFKNVNITGDNILHSKNVRTCFGGSNIEDSKFCSFVSNGPVKTTYDFTHYGDNIELVNECMQSGNGIYNIKYSWGVWNTSSNVSYGITMPGVSDVFGCVGLKKKQYCILNKQYTKEEYEVLIPKIIQHMNDMPYIDKKGRVYKYGEFFPIELSPFGYNETSAQDYFPLNKNQAFLNEFNWREPRARDYKITVSSSNLPDLIDEVPDSIVDEIIGCEHVGECADDCTTAFRVRSEDLKFYKRMNLPLPRLCSNCRRYARLKQRNPLKLWHRKCMKEGCENEFENRYAPERPEIIYCERCYQQEVY